MGNTTQKTAKFLDNETFVSVIDEKSSTTTGGGGTSPETDSPHHPHPAERALWRAVITQALQDALGNSKKREAKYEKFKAKAWLLSMSRDFITVCHHADYDPQYVRRKAGEILGNSNSRLPRQKKTMLHLIDSSFSTPPAPPPLPARLSAMGAAA